MQRCRHRRLRALHPLRPMHSMEIIRHTSKRFIAKRNLVACLVVSEHLARMLSEDVVRADSMQPVPAVPAVRCTAGFSASWELKRQLVCTHHILYDCCRGVPRSWMAQLCLLALLWNSRLESNRQGMCWLACTGCNSFGRSLL
jgi:hypothetical protein